MFLILLQGAAHGLDPRSEIKFSDRRDPLVQRSDIGGNGLSDFNLALCLLRIIAKQEILLRPAPFKELDFDLSVQLRDGSRPFGRDPVRLQNAFAIEMDSANKNDPKQPDDADCKNLVGQPDAHDHVQIKSRKITELEIVNLEPLNLRLRPKSRTNTENENSTATRSPCCLRRPRETKLSKSRTGLRRPDHRRCTWSPRPIWPCGGGLPAGGVRSTALRSCRRGGRSRSSRH